MCLVQSPECGGRPGVISDEVEGRRGHVMVPGPSEVAGAVSVEPAHGRSEPSGVVRLAPELRNYERHNRGYRGDLSVKLAGGVVVEPVEVVDMPRGHQIVERVARLVGQPLRNVVGPVDAVQHDDIGRAGGADAVDDHLHTGYLERDPGARAAVAPAGPGDVVRLVVGLEEHRVVALESRGDL